MVQSVSMAASIGVSATKSPRSSGAAADPPVPAWLFPALFAGAILAYWMSRISRGFWIDEATAYWIDQGGLAKAWSKLETFPFGQSLLYQYVVSPFLSDGAHKEALLRVPSVAGVLLAAWLLYKLTERIVGPGSGWLAVVPFACTGAIVETATNARPYALGLAVILASFWSLREWVHTGKRSWLALYCASSALVVYFHYLFVLIFLVQTVYLIAAHSSGRLFSWARILAVAFAIVVAAVPLAKQMLTLVGQADKWTSAVRPTAGTFLSLFPWQVAITVTIGLFLCFVLHRDWFANVFALSADDLILLVAWVLLGPLVMFVAQRTTSLAVFTTRYLIYVFPPCFILLAWCIRQMRNRRAQFALALAVVLNAALYVRDVGANTPEWRTPLRVAQRIAGGGTPILLRSPHADGVGFDWKTEPNPAHHYFAQLGPYPVRNEIIPVPFFVDAAAERYLEQEIERRMAAQRRFCLIANKGSDVLATLPAWFRTHGFAVDTRDCAGIEVLSFQR